MWAHAGMRRPKRPKLTQAPFLMRLSQRATSAARMGQARTRSNLSRAIASNVSSTVWTTPTS